MPQFPISRKLPSESTRDERNCRIIRLELDNEWAIVIRLSAIVIRLSGGFYGSLKSIEIHRRNTTGEYSISGKLRFTSQIFYSPEHKFSQYIKDGSTFLEIASNSVQPITLNPGISLVGHVNILECGIKQATSSAIAEEKIQIKSLKELSKDLERILNPESSCFADVTLKCDGVSIPAHKVILSARSPVFAAMFANPMKESHKNEVDITDIEEAVLRDLLMYMNFGKTSDLTVESAADLLFAADKYQIQDLKMVCTSFLKTSLSFQTVWRILVLGDLLSEDLKSFAVDYICSNSGDFSVLKNSEEFKALRKERPELAMDLLESMVQYREEKLKQLS